MLDSGSSLDPAVGRSGGGKCWLLWDVAVDPPDGRPRGWWKSGRAAAEERWRSGKRADLDEGMMEERLTSGRIGKQRQQSPI